MSENEESPASSSSPSVPEDERKLFVGGLPQEASEADLKEHFDGYGTVTSTVLKMDLMTGRSRGFAFVVFASKDSVSEVLEHDHVIKGKKVACKKATARVGKIYVGKFSDCSISNEDLISFFNQYGPVVEIQRPVDRSKDFEPKNFCFVSFENEEPAERLLKEKKVSLHGQELEIKKVTGKSEHGRGGRGGGRSNAPWGVGGGGGGGGYDPWRGGYDGSWGYGATAPLSAPWGWGGWSSAGGYGGGKLGAGTGGGGGAGYRGGRGGGRGRNTPY